MSEVHIADTGNQLFLTMLGNAVGGLARALRSSGSPVCGKLLGELHLSARKRDESGFLEGLRIGQDITALSAEGRRHVGDVLSVFKGASIDWEEWETISQAFQGPVGVDVATDVAIGTISKSFDRMLMRGFVALDDGREAWAAPNAFVDVQMPIAIGDRVVGELVHARHTLLLRNIRKA